MLEKIKNTFFLATSRLKENSCESLFWLVNILPTFGGFSLFKEKINATFWWLHFALQSYVYIVGTVVYNKYYSRDAVDFVNSFFNISIFVVIFNATFWTLGKRYDLKIILQLVKKNDDLVKESPRFVREHKEILKNIKIILLGLYMFHFVNDVLIFTTARIFQTNDLVIASCNGLDPLSGTPNMEICKAMLMIQETAAIVVVASYDVMLIFLITHTTAMFKLLHLETSELRTTIGDDGTHIHLTLVSNRLKNIINRHAKVVETVKKLQAIYSVAIGVDFGNNAISVCLFFILPLELCVDFGPLVCYNLLVFFLYCLLGQRLTTASEEFGNALYSCSWENFALREKKAVVFMIKQSQKPVILLAADIVPIRIYTFANTMQLIYKFVTVFKL